MLYAIGDLHISDAIWDRQRSITGDSAFMLKEISDLLTGDDDLVLVGDVFDESEPGPTLGRLFREWAELVASAGNRIWVLQGNHDKRATPWPLAFTSCLTYIGDGKEVVIAGKRCRALDYAPRDIIAKKLAWLGTQTLPEILFLHQAVKQYMAIEGTWNCDLEWVPEGIPLVVMGDIHEPWGQNIRAGQYACYTGAGHPRDITQARHQASVLRIEHDGPEFDLVRAPIRTRAIMAAECCAATLETVRGATREWVRALLAENGKETAPAAPLETLPPVLHLTYSDDCPSAPALIQEAIADLGTKLFILGFPVVTRATGTVRVDPSVAAQGIPTVPELLAKSGLAKTEQIAATVVELIRPGKATEIRGRLDLIRGQFFKDYDASHPGAAGALT